MCMYVHRTDTPHTPRTHTPEAGGYICPCMPEIDMYPCHIHMPEMDKEMDNEGKKNHSLQFE